MVTNNSPPSEQPPNESFSIDNQVQDRSPIPFHPGALKYFKEKGVGG